MSKNTYWNETYRPQVESVENYFLRHQLFNGNTISAVVKPNRLFYFNTVEKIDGEVVDRKS